MTLKMKDAFWTLGAVCVIAIICSGITHMVVMSIHTHREVERIMTQAEELNNQIQEDLANLRVEIEDLVAAIREQNRRNTPPIRPESGFSRSISDFFTVEPLYLDGRRNITYDDIFSRLSGLMEMVEAGRSQNAYILSLLTAIPEEPPPAIIPSARFTWMSYRAITNRSSYQWRLQQTAYTGAYGIRHYNNRPLVAVGTGWGGWVGDEIRVEFTSGEVLYAIIGDIKSDAHTCPQNITTRHNGCNLEFIIDGNRICETARRHGCFARTLRIDGSVQRIQVL